MGISSAFQNSLSTWRDRDMNPIAYPDLTGYAPSSEHYYAVDDDAYDGAPDSGLRARCMGHGATPEEAIADLMEQLADQEPIETPRRFVHGLIGEKVEVCSYV